MYVTCINGFYIFYTENIANSELKMVKTVERKYYLHANDFQLQQFILIRFSLYIIKTITSENDNLYLLTYKYRNKV